MAASNKRRLTDEQLRSAQLKIENPLEYEGVTSSPPNKEASPVVLAEYDLAKDTAPVRCSFCEQRQPHWRGFIVEFEAPDRHLVGSQCGTAKLDLDFKQAKGSHAELVSRQACLLRCDQILAQLDKFIAAADVVIFADEVKLVEASAKGFEVAAPDAFLRLRSLSLSGGMLTETVRQRDTAAELERSARVEDGSDLAPIYRQGEVSLSSLKGRGLLEGARLRGRVFELKQALKDFPALMRGDTATTSTAKFRAALLRLKQLREEANGAIDMLNGAPQFFSAEHIQSIERWAAGKTRDRIAAREAGLFANGKILQALPQFELPHIPALP